MFITKNAEHLCILLWKSRILLAIPTNFKLEKWLLATNVVPFFWERKGGKQKLFEVAKIKFSSKNAKDQKIDSYGGENLYKRCQKTLFV